MRVEGGKAIYGARIGILMLEARFPRIPGDMGNAQTWEFPVLYRVVPGASPHRVVRERAAGLLEPFVAAARSLVADGAEAITTNCGFLSLFQAELAAAQPVPVLTSALQQVRGVNALLPSGKVAGILTISNTSLSQDHLTAAGVPPGTPIGSTEDGQEFTRAILGNESTLDIEAARQDNVAAARALQQAHPNLGAMVLECTNMPPYAEDIAAATGLPVFSMVTFVNWLHAGLAPRSYPANL